MAKKKSSVDFKQVLLQRGERFGIAVAGVLALLLVVLSLFMPNKGFFSGNPAEKAKALIDPTTWVDNRLRDPNNLPTDNDKPPKESAKQLVGLKLDPIEGEKYRTGLFVPPENKGDLGRQVPKIYGIEEGTAKFAHMQYQSYIITEFDPPKILALQGGEGGGTGGMTGASAGAPSTRNLAQFLRGRGRPGGGMMGGGGMGGGMPGNLGMPGAVKPGEGETKKDRPVLAITLTELEKKGNITLAEQARPVRLAVIAASFPYKKQIEEFQAKLRLKAAGDVLAEASTETTPDKGALGSFRFLGVNVQRRELDGDGKPMGEFQKLDLNRDYLPYIVQTGRRFEPEKPEHLPLIVPGLVMPRLMQFRAENVAKSGTGSPMGMGMAGGGTSGFDSLPGMGATRPMGATDDRSMSKHDRYPNVEDSLATIKKTLEDLKGKNPGEVAVLPSRFRTGDEDVFSLRSDSGAGTDPMGMGAAAARPMGTGVVRPGVRNPMGADPMGSGTATTVEPPEYCLVRLIDVTVQPGRSYEYRLQVRMANPNYRRSDVASPTYATEKELLSEWSKVPIQVRIDQELYYYAADQMELERAENPRAKYEGPRFNLASGNRQVVLQAHRWLDRVSMSSGNPLLIGEWSVVERFPVFRGEYVGRRARVELPYWRYTREEFVIASDATTTKRQPGIDVDFGYGAGNVQPEAILVDFEPSAQGYARVVSRTEDKVETRPVTDQYGAEVLLLKPDGRLAVLEGGRDAADKEREERVMKVRKRIREVKNKGKDGGIDPKKPFGE